MMSSLFINSLYVEVWNLLDIKYGQPNILFVFFLIYGSYLLLEACIDSSIFTKNNEGILDLG